MFLMPCVSSGLPSAPNQVLLLTYDLVKKLPAQTAARFGVVICDESHQLKNKDAQRTQAVGRLVRGARVAMLLTGTPLLSRPIEAWSQVGVGICLLLVTLCTESCRCFTAFEDR